MLLSLSRTLIPSNIVSAAASGNTLSLIVCMFAFGLCIPAVSSAETLAKVLAVVDEIGKTMTVIIRFIILTTPVAVFSMVLKQVLLNPDLLRMLKLAAVLLSSDLIGLGLHFFATLPLVYFVLNRANPYVLIRRSVPAMVTAFATASSAATLPTALKVAEEAIGVSKEAMNFVLPLGASISMDGSALHLTATMTFLTYSQGGHFEFQHFFSLGISATLLSLGISPIPGSSLSLIIVLWNSVFPGAAPPVNLGFLFALDWLLNRFRTPVNVIIDLYVVSIMDRLLTGREPNWKKK